MGYESVVYVISDKGTPSACHERVRHYESTLRGGYQALDLILADQSRYSEQPPSPPDTAVDEVRSSKELIAICLIQASVQCGHLGEQVNPVVSATPSYLTQPGPLLPAEADTAGSQQYR